MNDETIDSELIKPPGFKDELIKFGLERTSIDITELYMDEEFAWKYKKLSVYDRIALAIAKNRNMVLLTGDRRLRQAAMDEKSQTHRNHRSS